MLESGFATPAPPTFDAGMVQGCAHPQAPLALTDLIGLDMTAAVAQSMYQEFKEPLFAPPLLLLRTVDAGLLACQAGRGFHPYVRRSREPRHGERGSRHPAHTPRRKLLTRILSPRALRSLREPFAAAAGRFVDDVLERGTASVTWPRPTRSRSSADAVGLDASVEPHLLIYGDLAFKTAGPENDLLRGAMAGARPTIEAIMAQPKRDALKAPGLG